MDILGALKSRLRSAFKRDSDYERRLSSEIATYKGCLDVNDLPAIFHYWSNKYLGPKLAALGFAQPDEFFARHLQRAAEGHLGQRPTFVSIGAGNCDTEVRVAKFLRNLGLATFEIECVDINADMLDRGQKLARIEGVADSMSFSLADFNQWYPARAYDAVMANQSLHHVMELEHLFDAVQEAIRDRGTFIVSDIIGRNGHQRWPEAQAIVQEFWQDLPAAYRFNQQLKRHEERFLDWDCSVGTFEGIRAQDILPLLVERFQFDVFAAFANVIDPFIDRGFGHNFDPEAEWDRAFIDRVQARDEMEILAGRIKPTHMMAVMQVAGSGREVFLDGLTPRACVRRPD